MSTRSVPADPFLVGGPHVPGDPAAVRHFLQAVTHEVAAGCPRCGHTVRVTTNDVPSYDCLLCGWASRLHPDLHGREVPA